LLSLAAEVRNALAAAGFVPRDFQQANLYGVPQPEPAALPPGITIERVTEENLGEYVQVTSEGFAWHPVWRDIAKEDLRHEFEPGSLWFLARYAGEAAGAASLQLREGVAKLSGCAVVILDAAVPGLREGAVGVGFGQRFGVAARRIGAPHRHIAQKHKAVIVALAIPVAIRIVQRLGGLIREEANLSVATLTLADLSRAKLTRAELHGAKFLATKLTGTRFTEAHLNMTVFAGCLLLHEAVGLEEARCTPPISLDRHTLRTCIGTLPDAFLESIGLTRHEVAGLRALYT
jgi:hypothetical protein